MKKTILLFGSQGFLGKHFMKYHRPGYSIIPADIIEPSVNYPPGYLTADIGNYKIVHSLIRDIKPQVIVNCAGVYRAESVATYYRVNTIGSINILEAIRRIKSYRPRVLLIGSAAEYGMVTREELPIREEHPLRPVTLYGISKSAQTFYMQFYARTGVDVILARIFNMIGADLPIQLAPASFASQIALVEAGRARNIKVGNLKCRRDFIAVEQAAQGLWFLLIKGKRGEVYNICNGKSYSLALLLSQLISISQVKIKIIHERIERKAADVGDIYGSNAKLYKWGFTISPPDIECYLRQMLEYWRYQVRLSPGLKISTTTGVKPVACNNVE